MRTMSASKPAFFISALAGLGDVAASKSAMTTVAPASARARQQDRPIERPPPGDDRDAAVEFQLLQEHGVTSLD